MHLKYISISYSSILFCQWEGCWGYLLCPGSSIHPSRTLEPFTSAMFHLLNLSFRCLFYGRHLLSLSASDVYPSPFHSSSALLGFWIQAPPHAHCPLAQVHPHPDESLCNALCYQIQHKKCLAESCHAVVPILCSTTTTTLLHPSCPCVFPCVTSDLSSQPLLIKFTSICLHCSWFWRKISN